MLAQRGCAAEAGLEGHDIHRFFRGFQQALRQFDALAGQPVAKTGADRLLEAAGEGAPCQAGGLGDAVEVVRLAKGRANRVKRLGEPVCISAFGVSTPITGPRRGGPRSTRARCPT